MSRSRLLSAPRSFQFISGVSRPASGIRIGFISIDKENTGGAYQEAPHFFMDITDMSARRLMITFHNTGTAPCIISDI